jgi:hypothetical protein
MTFDIEEFRESLDTPTLSDSRRYRDAPIRILDSINAYVKDRQRPGGFVTAVLEDRLTAALRAADSASRRGLDDILLYVWNEIPATCWGSPARVAEWLGEENPETQKDLFQYTSSGKDLLLTASAKTLESYLDAAHDIGGAHANREDHDK